MRASARAARARSDASRALRPRPPAPPLLREVDRLLHERVRLGIVSLLAANGVLSFAELKELLRTTDGNLSVHARRLEEAGYVACAKSFAGRTPRTEYRLTAAGRRAFARHLDHLEALVESARRI